NAWLGADSRCDMRKRASRDDGYVSVGGHEQVDEQVNTMLQRRLDIRFWNIWSIHARLAMDISCMPCRAHQGAIHAPGNRHVTDICQRTHFQGVKGSLVNRLVTCNGSDSQQINVGMVGREKDCNGIIMAGVTVENNFVFHLLPF